MRCGKKIKTATLLTRSVDATATLRTIVSQRHAYDKGEAIAQRKIEKETRTKLGKEAHTNFTASMILKNKKNQNKQTNVAYRTETESEQEGLYLYTVEEDNREEIFANIDCVDSGEDKHKIKMK